MRLHRLYHNVVHFLGNTTGILMLFVIDVGIRKCGKSRDVIPDENVGLIIHKTVGLILHKNVALNQVMNAQWENRGITLLLL
jgi:hypothetical protein